MRQVWGGDIFYSPLPHLGYVTNIIIYIYIYFKSRHSKFSLDFSFPISCQQRSYEWLMAWGRLDYWCYHLRLSHCWTVWRRLWITFFFFFYCWCLINWIDFINKFLHLLLLFPLKFLSLCEPGSYLPNYIWLKSVGTLVEFLRSLFGLDILTFFFFGVWFCSTLKLVCIC